jgi:hypothetical protein
VDVPERVEREQIGVAGDDQIGMAVYRQLQKLVVGSRHAATRSVMVTSSAPAKFPQPSPSVGVDQRDKVRAGDDRE